MPVPDHELTTRPKRVPMPDCGLVVFESRHAPGFYGEMTDAYAKFHLVIAGQASWESARRTYDVGPNTLFHIAEMVPHRQRDLPGQPVTLYAIHYRPELLRPELKRELTAAQMLPVALGSPNPERGRIVKRIVQDMLFEQEARRFGWEAWLVSRLADLAVLSIRAVREDEQRSTRYDDGLARVNAYADRLQNSFYVQEDLNTAARSVGLGRRRFTELFRQATGTSWRRRVNELRLEYAARLLETTERSVTAIGFECGFDDLSHFHRRFKARYRTTPHAFRLRNRPKSQS